MCHNFPEVTKKIQFPFSCSQVKLTGLNQIMSFLKFDPQAVNSFLSFLIEFLFGQREKESSQPFAAKRDLDASFDKKIKILK